MSTTLQQKVAEGGAQLRIVLAGMESQRRGQRLHQKLGSLLALMTPSGLATLAAVCGSLLQATPST
jgi:hypothetical protein